MILSFHPCFVGDAQVILGDRRLNADDRRFIQTADAIILPQSCSLGLYKVCKNSDAYVFPDYDLRFRYPGKVGQSLLFEKMEIPHPATKRWPSVKKFRTLLKQQGALVHEMPFFLKADRSHEGEGVYFVTDGDTLEAALRRLEKARPEGFISQEVIPCKGNVLRAVVLYKRIITYWKRPAKPDEVITTISHGSQIDKDWKPDLQEKGRTQAQWISEKTGINLAAFDFVFDLGNPNPQPLILEINYYFGRRGLGGSLKYYGLLLKAIREWLKENGFDAGLMKLV